MEGSGGCRGWGAMTTDDGRGCRGRAEGGAGVLQSQGGNDVRHRDDRGRGVEGGGGGGGGGWGGRCLDRNNEGNGGRRRLGGGRGSAVVRVASMVVERAPPWNARGGRGGKGDVGPSSRNGKDASTAR